MRLPTAKTLSDSTLVPLWLLLRDFATFAGTKGLKAFLFVFLGAVVEGVGLVLLIPFFSVIIDSQNTGGWVQGASAWLFTLFSAESRFAKLGVLVVLFAMLMVARAVIITVRDVTMAELQIGFVQGDPFADHPPPSRSAMGHSLALAPQPYNAPDERGHPAARERDLHPNARCSCRHHAGEPDCIGLFAGASSCRIGARRCALGRRDAAPDGEAGARNRKFCHECQSLAD